MVILKPVSSYRKFLYPDLLRVFIDQRSVMEPEGVKSSPQTVLYSPVVRNVFHIFKWGEKIKE